MSGGYGYGGGFALIVVLFILLIIVGAAWLYEPTKSICSEKPALEIFGLVFHCSLI